MNHPALKWKVVFIGNSDSDLYDQLLEEFEVPIDGVGEFNFNVGASAPVLKNLPCMEDVFDTTAVSLIAYFEEREFFRCSYLITHDYLDQQRPAEYTEEGLLR